MANPLRMLSRAAPPRSPEREALAAAIERRNNAVRNLDATSKAFGEARAGSTAAEQAVTAAREAVETAKRNAVTHLTSRMMGEVNDAPMSVRDAQDALRGAEDDAAALKQVETGLQSQLSACEHEMEWSKRLLDQAITDVVRSGPGVRKLIAEYHAVQEELERRRLVLLWLSGRNSSRVDNGLIPHELRHWDALPQFTDPGSGLPDGAGPWAAVFLELASNPDAPLPGT